MRMSEEKRAALYEAIRDEVMDLRIKYANDKGVDMDSELFNLEMAIWRRVKSVLNIGVDQ